MPLKLIAQLFKQSSMPAIRARLAALPADTLEDERGQGLTEYALILALIAVVAIAALAFFGNTVTSVLSSVASSV
jgi:pilus assembly protein Flp/PilA